MKSDHDSISHWMSIISEENSTQYHSTYLDTDNKSRRRLEASEMISVAPTLFNTAFTPTFFHFFHLLLWIKNTSVNKNICRDRFKNLTTKYDVADLFHLSLFLN